MKQLLDAFHASLICYESNDNTTKKLLVHAAEYDIVLFDMHTLSSSATNIISMLKVIHPHIKCIGLIGQNTNLPKSNFDTLIYDTLSPKDIVFTLEEFSANEHAINTGFMDFSYLRVLVVEDVEMSYEYIQQMLLVSFSIDCDLATNGKDAVEKVKNNSYDVIFMDIRMPIMNGYDATKAIREFNKEIPIVCMSADVYAKDVEAAKEAGMDRFISKPIDKNEIKQVFLDLNSVTVRKNIPRVPFTQDEKPEHAEAIAYNPLELKKEAYKHLQELFNDDIIISNLLGKAVESLEKYLSSIKLNKIEQNTAALVEDMHAMKGVLANLGLKKPSSTAGEIQKRFQSGDLNKAYRIKNEFVQNITHFVNELKKEIG